MSRFSELFRPKQTVETKPVVKEPEVKVPPVLKTKSLTHRFGKTLSSKDNL